MWVPVEDVRSWGTLQGDTGSLGALQRLVFLHDFHSEYLAAFLFYQAPLIATLLSLPVTFKMAQYMSLQNVHVISRNLKDKRHTVAVLGADPDRLVLYSFSLCSFILPQNIHKANTLTICITSLDPRVAVSLTLVA